MSDASHNSHACLRFGWGALAIFMLLGLVLESLHLIKWPDYMEVRIRRELWTLAHAHGSLFAILNIVFGLYAGRLKETAALARASVSLRAGALALPLGFFAGGIANTETDPSLAIVLVPVGALLALYAVIVAARSAWRGEEPVIQTPAGLPSESKAKSKKSKRK